MSKNPGGKPRNPKLDQPSRYFNHAVKQGLPDQMSPPKARPEDLELNDKYEKESLQRTQRIISDKMSSDAFVQDNLNNKQFTENYNDRPQMMGNND